MPSLKELLTPPKTIAVVGLSDKSERPSYKVARYLLRQGFKILPVNPTITQFLDLPSYPSFSVISTQIQIDIVDIFRKSEEVLSVVEEVIKSGQRPIIWMQEGVISPEAKKLAETNGLTVIMDQCLMKVHQRLFQL